jgi:tetratricopeptide (TPR) repeat protein
MKTLCLILSALICLLAGGLRAQTADDAFNAGNAAYREGRFEDAVRAYESILRQGLGSAALYYNLGNAYYRLGKIGQSILAYERALQLDPGDQDVRQNLKLANFRAIDRIEPVPEFFLVSWLRGLASLAPLSVTTVVFVTAWGIFFVSLASIYLVLPVALKRAARWTGLSSALVAVVTAAVLVLQVLEVGGRDEAIVVAPVVTAKNSPDAQGTDAFVIHEGLKARVSDAVGEWVKITLPDGKVGWILASQCERI